MLQSGISLIWLFAVLLHVGPSLQSSAGHDDSVDHPISRDSLYALYADRESLPPSEQRQRDTVDFITSLYSEEEEDGSQRDSSEVDEISVLDFSNDAILSQFEMVTPESLRQEGSPARSVTPVGSAQPPTPAGSHVNRRAFIMESTNTGPYLQSLLEVSRRPVSPVIATRSSSLQQDTDLPYLTSTKPQPGCFFDMDSSGEEDIGQSTPNAVPAGLVPARRASSPNMMGDLRRALPHADHRLSHQQSFDTFGQAVLEQSEAPTPRRSIESDDQSLASTLHRASIAPSLARSSVFRSEEDAQILEVDRVVNLSDSVSGLSKPTLVRPPLRSHATGSSDGAQRSLNSAAGSDSTTSAGTTRGTSSTNLANRDVLAALAPASSRSQILFNSGLLSSQPSSQMSSPAVAYDFLNSDPVVSTPLRSRWSIRNLRKSSQSQREGMNDLFPLDMSPLSVSAWSSPGSAASSPKDATFRRAFASTTHVDHVPSRPSILSRRSEEVPRSRPSFAASERKASGKSPKKASFLGKLNAKWRGASANEAIEGVRPQPNRFASVPPASTPAKPSRNFFSLRPTPSTSSMSEDSTPLDSPVSPETPKVSFSFKGNRQRGASDVSSLPRKSTNLGRFTETYDLTH